MELVCIYLCSLLICKVCWAVIGVFSQSPIQAKNVWTNNCSPSHLPLHVLENMFHFINSQLLFFSPSLPRACSSDHSRKGCLFSERMLKQNMLTELAEILDKCHWMGWFLSCGIIRPHQQLRLLWLCQALSTAVVAVIPKLCRLSFLYSLAFLFFPVSSPSLTYSVSSACHAAATWPGALMNLKNGLIKDKMFYPCRALCQGLIWSWLAI